TEPDRPGPPPGAPWMLRGEDPTCPGQPVVVRLARDWKVLLAGIENLMPSARPGAQVVSQAGGLAQRDPWGAMPHQGFRWSKASNHGNLFMRTTLEVSSERSAIYFAQAVGALDAIEAWANQKLSTRLDLRVCAYPSLFRELCGRDGLSAWDELPGTRLVLLAKGMADDGGACSARWAATELLGPASANWMLDGAALDAAGTWWGKDLAAWGKHLQAGGLLPQAKVLIAGGSSDELSQHQLAPARGLFFRFLRESRGAESIQGLWKGQTGLTDLAALDVEFQDWLSQQITTPLQSEAAPTGESFQTGVVLASSAAPGGGFDGPRLAASLAGARRQGANGLGITSFFAERGNPVGARVPSGRECLEGDAALAFAVGAARQSGLRHVTLETHLLISTSAGYSAWQRRTSEGHWAEFFDDFDTALVHYGLLAQLCGVDLLSMGSRLASPSWNAGLMAEVKEYHDRRWAQAIELVRSAYTGGLTYAAAANGEARSYGLWDSLDCIGISLFSSRSQLGAAPRGSGPLRNQWNSILNDLETLAKERGKPVMLLEFGARSVDDATSEVSVGAGPADMDQQLLYWKSFTDVLESRRARGSSTLQTLAGVYAWKWGAAASSGGIDDRDFDLQGKPAALELGSLAPRD
ncbi:MAG: hypothetical protein ACI9F9_000605, partial [Candidatus Paceibacteria bacterium]